MKPTSHDPKFTVLKLERLRCQVHLGWTAAERVETQSVLVDIVLRFSSLPEGARTDRLKGTVNYAELARTTRAVCVRQEYKLIEKLGFDLFTEIKKTLPAEIALMVRVNKENPPVPGLEGGATFVCSDWETT